MAGFLKDKTPRTNSMPATAIVDRRDIADKEVMFEQFDIVYFIAGGPAMVIEEFIGKDRASCKWFTSNGVCMMQNFRLATLVHKLEDV